MTPPRVVAFHAVAWSGPRHALRIAADDVGRLLVWRVHAAAQAFAGRLAGHGLSAHVVPTSPADARDLLNASGIPDDQVEDMVVFVEKQTTGPADLLDWSIELADRLVQQARVGSR